MRVSQTDLNNECDQQQSGHTGLRNAGLRRKPARVCDATREQQATRLQIADGKQERVIRRKDLGLRVD